MAGKTKSLDAGKVLGHRAGKITADDGRTRVARRDETKKLVKPKGPSRRAKK